MPPSSRDSLPTTPAPSVWLPELDGNWQSRHRAHDVPYLLQRWRAVVKAARLRLHVIHEVRGFPVYFLTSRHAGTRPLYFSAGVHGDEPGAVLGLLEWAERSIAYLRRADVILVPLFNPAGLSLNIRLDSEGTDLNRFFDHPSHPHITGWRKAMSGFSPRLAVCLHEDYDAQGLYAYELNRDATLRLAESCLRTTDSMLPRDSRRKIEGRPARSGIIRRRRLPMVENLPEAVILYQSGTSCTLTFETPSEFSLAIRTRAHARLIQAACDWDATAGIS